MLLEDPADFIDVTELRAHLNKTITSNATEIQQFVSAACAKVVDLVGQVSLVKAQDDVCIRGGVVILQHRPVASVTSVQRLPGGDTIPAADRLAGTHGWYLDSAEGVLRHTLGFPGTVRVHYEAGRDPVPYNIRMGALDLAAHNWQRSQNNNQRPSIGDAEGVLIPGVAWALPYSVRQWLGLGKHDTDRPLVG